MHFVVRKNHLCDIDGGGGGGVAMCCIEGSVCGRGSRVINVGKIVLTGI